MAKTTRRHHPRSRRPPYGASSARREPRDFVTFLASQLEAFRARRFDELDVEHVRCELEAVVGRYRHEVAHRARRLIPILMRPYYVYGYWNDLRHEAYMLRSAVEDSPSLAARANREIKGAYFHARTKRNSMERAAGLHAAPGRR